MPRKDLIADIRLLGDKELERKLKKLGGPAGTRVVRAAMRKSARRIHKVVISNLTGGVVNVRTGNLSRAFKSQKIKSDKAARGRVRLGIPMPTREELNIPAKAKAFYPISVEFGHGSVPAYSYLRSAVDKNKQGEYTKIGNDIGRGITRLAKRL